MTFIPLGKEIPDSFIKRIVLDSDFTKKEHLQRKKEVCPHCNSGHKPSDCIHTAECTYQFLKDTGHLLPEADTEECPDNRGIYLVYTKPPAGRDDWLKKFRTGFCPGGK